MLTLVLAIVERSDDMRGFVVLPRRWSVEQLFAHLMRTRHLAATASAVPPAPYHQCRATSAEATVYWSMILLITSRLVGSRTPPA